MRFELISSITDIEPIAIGASIRVIAELRNSYGAGRWRKLKGRATVRFENGEVAFAEVHWYEAHGVRRRDIKIKRILDH